jgi:hypothetical protein
MHFPLQAAFFSLTREVTGHAAPDIPCERARHARTLAENRENVKTKDLTGGCREGSSFYRKKAHAAGAPLLLMVSQSGIKKGRGQCPLPRICSPRWGLII